MLKLQILMTFYKNWWMASRPRRVQQVDSVKLNAEGKQIGRSMRTKFAMADHKEGQVERSSDGDISTQGNPDGSALNLNPDDESDFRTEVDAEMDKNLVDRLQSADTEVHFNQNRDLDGRVSEGYTYDLTMGDDHDEHDVGENNVWEQKQCEIWENQAKMEKMCKRLQRQRQIAEQKLQEERQKWSWHRWS